MGPRVFVRIISTTVIAWEISILASRGDDAARAFRARPNQAALLCTTGWSVADLAIDREAADAISRDAFDFVSPVYDTGDGDALIVTPDLLVAFAEDVTPDRAHEILAAANAGRVVRSVWSGIAGPHQIRTPCRHADDVLAIADALGALPEVRFAEPDVIFTGRGDLVPDDPNFARLWGLNNTGQNRGTADVDIDAVEAWDATTGSSNILVVVLDTGVQQDHPDLNQIPGADFTSDGTTGKGGPVNTCDRHGTPVAGCVAGKLNNALGTVGVAPGCRVASARVFISNSPCDGTWTSQSSWTVAALAWAESIGARVTVNANGYGFQSSAIAQKYADTRARGMIHFASAGNTASNAVTYPASLPSVLAVGAIDRTAKLAPTSNHGSDLAFVAPGVSIYTTDRTGSAGYSAADYTLVSGTSFAAPYAAGVAALALSRNSSLTASNIEEILRQSCTDLGATGFDTAFGFGLVNAQRALQLTP